MAGGDDGPSNVASDGAQQGAVHAIDGTRQAMQGRLIDHQGIRQSGIAVEQLQQEGQQ